MNQAKLDIRFVPEAGIIAVWYRFGTEISDTT
jgi:hypothetical protein